MLIELLAFIRIPLDDSDSISPFSKSLDVFCGGAEGGGDGVNVMFACFFGCPFSGPRPPLIPCMEPTYVLLLEGWHMARERDNATQHESWQNALFRGKYVSTRLRKAEARVACEVRF